MAKAPMSIRLPQEKKDLLDAIAYVLGVAQVDVIEHGIDLYYESLPDEDKIKITQAKYLKK